MKKILCLGDSNTYGFNPLNGARYNAQTRWTGVLKTLLSERCEIVEAGCNNRTCFVDNPAGIEQTGVKTVSKYLSQELFGVIFALGINDLQKFFDVTLEDFENGLENLVNIVKNNSSKVKILLVCPSRLTKDVLSGAFAFQFDEKSIEKSMRLPEIYRHVAVKTNSYLLDLNDVAQVSEADGLHYMPEEHEKIAQGFYRFLCENWLT